MGSDESHFNVSVGSHGQSHKTVSANHNPFEEKGEPKRYRTHQNDSSIKIGSDESHFNVSVGSDGQSHKTVSTNHNLLEEKGELKRYRTEVLPLTSLTALSG